MVYVHGPRWRGFEVLFEVLLVSPISSIIKLIKNEFLIHFIVSRIIVYSKIWKMTKFLCLISLYHQL